MDFLSVKDYLQTPKTNKQLFTANTDWRVSGPPVSSGRDCDRMSDFGGCGLAAGSDLPVASPPVLVF